MKSAIHFLKLLAIGALLLEGLLSASAIAGPATYDKETKSFRLTYTFANLAGAGIGDQVVGAAYKPAPDEEDLVKALAAQVSDVLFRATEGRAKIGRLDFVDDIKNADLVVSKTGKPSSQAGPPGARSITSLVISSSTIRRFCPSSSRTLCTREPTRCPTTCSV